MYKYILTSSQVAMCVDNSYVILVITALMDENLQYLSQRQTASPMEKKQIATICILYWAFLHDDQ